MPTMLEAPARPLPMENIADLVSSFLSRLEAYVGNPMGEQELSECLSTRRLLAKAFAAQPKSEQEGPVMEEGKRVLEKIAASGLWDLPVQAEDAAMVEDFAVKSWPGLMAAMLLVPAWQWPKAPKLDEAPLFLWGTYAAYVFYAPEGFVSEGQAASFGSHALNRLGQLCRLAEANRGSAAVRAALSSYLAKGSCIPLYFSETNLRRHYELRGRILSIANQVGMQEAPLLLPRDGRKLRIGFLNRHFGPQTETYTTLPSFELLDPERFEVKLYALRQTGTVLEGYAASNASGGIVFLPESVDEQLRVLREETLDVLVFGTNLTAVFHELTRLALYRIAPLQVVNNSSCTTTGLPQIDLYVSGSYTETEDSAEHYTERLGLLPGPAHAFNYAADAVEPSQPLTRADLQVPDDAVLFVTASNFYKIIPEMMDCWAELLSRVPGSYLLVHPFNPNWSAEYPVKRFTGLLEQALTKRGVDHKRLVISTIKFPSRSDVGALLALGDLYLDSYPFGGVNSIIDPLEKGVPVVEWEGGFFRSRMGSAVLRQLGLQECCAQDREGYLALCEKLAKEPALRASLRERILHSMERLPLFFDMLAASDAFGELIGIAFDELCVKGHEEFRKDRSVIKAGPAEDPDTLLATSAYLVDIGMEAEAEAQLRSILASQPKHAEARRRMAGLLSKAGRHDRAAEYLLSAVQSSDCPTVFWRDLSSELRLCGNGEGARQSLETALRMDPNDVETWLMLGELAWDSRHEDIHNEVLGILPQLAPEDDRVKAFIARGKVPSSELQS